MRSGHRFKTITHLYRFNREEVKVSEAGLHIGCFYAASYIVSVFLYPVARPTSWIAHSLMCWMSGREAAQNVSRHQSHHLKYIECHISINPNSHNSQLSSKSNFVFNSQFDLKRPGEGSCPIAAISAPDIYFSPVQICSHTHNTNRKDQFLFSLLVVWGPCWGPWLLAGDPEVGCCYIPKTFSSGQQLWTWCITMK